MFGSAASRAHCGARAVRDGCNGSVRPRDDSCMTLTTAPHLTIVPGLMLVATVLALNVFGDGVRDAFDPRAKVRMER